MWCFEGGDPKKTPLEALESAKGPTVTFVEVSWDPSETLGRFARFCALDVIHLWEAPEVVLNYLRTGDESLKEIAWEAAVAGAWATQQAEGEPAWEAAESAAWATRGVFSAIWRVQKSARNAASGAAYEAAGKTADIDAWDTVWNAQNARLEVLLWASRPDLVSWVYDLAVKEPKFAAQVLKALEHPDVSLNEEIQILIQRAYVTATFALGGYHDLQPECSVRKKDSCS